MVNGVPKARPPGRGGIVSEEKRFPLQPEKGVTPGPLSCSWSVAEKSYGAYALRFGRSQSLETLAKRGGFSWGEMDDQYPAWREEESELARLTPGKEGKCKNWKHHALCPDGCPPSPGKGEDPK